MKERKNSFSLLKLSFILVFIAIFSLGSVMANSTFATEGDCKVVISYVDEENEEISPQTTISGNLGDEYQVDIMEIEGYQLDEEPENMEGTFDSDTTDVVFHYTKIDEELAEETNEGSNTSRADVSPRANVGVNDMTQLGAAISGATEDGTIQLSATFDTNPTATTTVVVNHSYNLVIEGGDKTINGMGLPAAGKHLNITNNGTGTLTFQNINFVGQSGTTGSGINKGGVNFNKGKYAFDKVTASNNIGAVNLVGVASFKVTNSTFSDNYRVASATAINAEGGVANLEISQSSFVNNEGGTGTGYSSGAIWVKDPKVVTIDKSYFKGNSSKSSNGGAAIGFTVAYANNINITNSYFSDNYADSDYPGGSSWADGGAIYYYGQAGGSGAHFRIDSSTFVNNYAHDDGGALLLQQPSANSETIVTNSTFVNNQANGKGPQGIIDSSGGAIQVALETDTTLVNNTFYDNKTGGAGTLNANQKGGAIGTHNDSGKNPTIASYNNIYLGNKALNASNGEINPEYANIDAVIFTDQGSVGVDNGTAVNSAIVNKMSVFGTDTPALQANGGGTFIGNNQGGNNLAYLPTITIVPKGLADGTGVANSLASVDARGVVRNTPPDAGAIEISYVKFDGNGGQWTGLNPLSYDGSVFYSGTQTSEFFLVSQNGGSVNAIGNDKLSNDDKTFKGWATTPNAMSPDYLPNAPISINGNQTLYAIWEAGGQELEFNTVTFDTNGGSANFSVEVTTGDAVNEPKVPTKNGYKFKGWYVDNNTFEEAYDFDNPVNSDFTLYAKWEKDKGGGGTTEKPDKEKPNKSKPSKTISKKSGTAKTGDDTLIMMFVAMGAISLILVLILARNRKFKANK